MPTTLQYKVYLKCKALSTFFQTTVTSVCIKVFFNYTLFCWRLSSIISRFYLLKMNENSPIAMQSVAIRRLLLPDRSLAANMKPPRENGMLLIAMLRT